MRKTERARALPPQLLAVAVVWWGVFLSESALAQKQERATGGPLITIHASYPQQYELALDEVELEWGAESPTTGKAPAAAAVAVAGAEKVKTGENQRRALFSLAEVRGLADLSTRAQALKDANPGSHVRLVLYEPGAPRSKATRLLLTHQVGVLLEPGEQIRDVLAGIPSESTHPVPEVPGGYIVEAAHPGAALDLADTLRAQPGVRSAYPLLQRFYFPR